jgi:hypothetical protein
MGVAAVLLLWAMLFFYSRPTKFVQSILLLLSHLATSICVHPTDVLFILIFREPFHVQNVRALIGSFWVCRHGNRETHSNDNNAVEDKPSRQFDFSGGEYVKLTNEVEMPIVTFGTAALKSPGSVIPYALQLGIKGIDTASDVGPWYKTEGVIGQLMKDYELHRSDYFIITKLHPSQNGYDSALKAVEASLKNLQTNYIDLFLIHYPACFGDLCTTEPEGTWKDSWRAMETEYKQKKLRAIGVSNFQLEQLKELKRIANIQPHVGSLRPSLRFTPLWPIHDIDVLNSDSLNRNQFRDGLIRFISRGTW